MPLFLDARTTAVWYYELRQMGEPTSLKGARGSKDASAVPIMGTRLSIELRGSMYISIGAAILILILLIIFVF